MGEEEERAGGGRGNIKGKRIGRKKKRRKKEKGREEVKWGKKTAFLFLSSLHPFSSPSIGAGPSLEYGVSIVGAGTEMAQS